MKPVWIRDGSDWWLRDLASVPDARGIHERALRGYWQKSAYETRTFAGTMLLANPFAAAPAIRIPLPAAGRWSIAVGMPENYSDRLLIKLSRDACFDKLAHGDVADEPSLHECWWRDAELAAGDELVLQQDAGMKRRCGVAYVRLWPAPEPTRAEIPFINVMDGFPCNNGPIALDEMVGEELQFADTHVSHICHGTDICGCAQYNTDLPAHRYPSERWAEEECISADYYPWVTEQLLKFEKAGRCTLRESIEAAHRIGRPFYAYHRMAITQIYAPMRMFGCDLYGQHPEWRCVDWDGTPVSRLSVAYPGVRQFMLEHFRETVERGADGVCLVLARGWPLILFEQPVADEYRRRTGKDMRAATPEDADLLRVRTDIVTGFIREIRQTVRDAAGGREVKIVALPLARPEINRHYGMDCGAWAREGLVQVFCPYPYGRVAKPEAIRVPEWAEELKGTPAMLCPIVNRMTYEPSGAREGLAVFVDRTEKWLGEGAQGVSIWDLDSAMTLPVFRRLGYNLGSAEGRRRLRELAAQGPVRHALKSMDGITVDRFHPGWNV